MHLCMAGLGGNDVAILEQLIAPAVITVRVRVDDGVNGGFFNNRLHALQHLPGKMQIPAGVYQNTFSMAVNQADIGFAPGTIGHHPAIALFAELIQSLLELNRFPVAGMAAPGVHQLFQVVHG